MGEARRVRIRWVSIAGVGTTTFEQDFLVGLLVYDGGFLNKQNPLLLRPGSTVPFLAQLYNVFFHSQRQLLVPFSFTAVAYLQY
jgi:hypothetical protein